MEHLLSNLDRLATHEHTPFLDERLQVDTHKSSVLSHAQTPNGERKYRQHALIRKTYKSTDPEQIKI